MSPIVAVVDDDEDEDILDAVEMVFAGHDSASN